MGADYYKTMEQGGKKAAAASRETRRSITELNAELASVKATATGLVGAFVGAFATHELIRYADTWNLLSGRLKLASVDAADFTAAQRTLMDISQRTGTSFEANANLYARIASSLRDAGYASADVAKVTETVATSLKLSGASTEESSSVITQLSQALGSGVLRGEEFNAIMENGGRLAKLLATGLNTTVGGLRNMANNGQLTTDKLIPILTNVEALRKEFETLPATVSGSAQKVQNAFMEWVGSTNDATGASAALSGVLDGLAKNINGVASAAGVLAAIGVARYFGGVTSGALGATSALINARKSQISLADAQVYAAVQAQRKAIASAEAARSDYNLALAETNLAKNTNASALATQNLTQKRSAMIAANSSLVLSNRAVTASQEMLNRATSTIGLVKSAGSGLLSLIGGMPGLVLAVGSAWLYVYEKNEQARKAALAYGREVADAAPANGLAIPSGDNTNEINKTAISMRAQADEVSRLNNEIAELTQQQYNAQQAMKNSAEGSWSYNSAQQALVEINAKLYSDQSRLDEVTKQLSATTDRHNILLRQNAAAANEYYNNLIKMTGQGALFRDTIEGINRAMSGNSGLAVSPMRLPQAPINAADQQTLQQKQQAAELAGLTGIEKARRQAQFDLQKMGRLGQQNTAYAEKYTQALVDEYNNTQRVSAAKKSDTDATNAKNKAEREAATTAEQYGRKIADLSVAIEVQKVRASQGEKAADLYAAANQAGTKWTEEQRKSIRASAAELANWTSRADDNIKKQHEQAEALKQLTEATRKFRDEGALATETGSMSDRQRQKFDETQQIDRLFDKAGGQGNSQAVAARIAALDELDKKYKAIAIAESDWRAGAQKGLENWMDNASNYADQTANLVSNTMSGFVDTLSGALSGNKASWEDWSKSVLQSMQKIILNAMLLNSMKSLGGSGFLGFMGFGGAAAGGASAAGGAAAGTGAMGLSTSFQGYDEGGYTGDGGKYEPKGVVHGGEFVFTKEATQKIGVENLSALMRNARGYAGGGYVGNNPTSMPLTRGTNSYNGGNTVGDSSYGAAGNGAPVIHQTFHVSGNGDAALRQAMQDAARQGAQDGAKQARQEMLQDFQTRGQGRRLLGV